MLTDSSYYTAIAVYCGSAVLVALLLAWWLGRRWSSGWATLAVLLSAAMLLTPAFPQPGEETMAPALIVAGFEMALNGPDAARHALKPLAAACGLALVLALLLRLTVLRPRRSSASQDEEQGGPDAT